MIMNKQEEYKRLKAVCRWIGFFIFANFLIVIFDAFMLKYNINISIILTADYISRQVSTLLYDIGWYIAKCMSITRVFWDILNSAWEFLRVYIPLEQIIQVKQWTRDFYGHVFVLCTGWWIGIVGGAIDALSDQDAIHVALTVLLVIAVYIYVGSK